ncbi:MAG: squalene/phytoene synthase family protein [Bacteroidales bacterium]|nr:squalene/phytoene synthase family protein [Bacteroidales bacterium]
MDILFNSVTYQISRLVTRKYSTSFSTAVGLLEKDKKRAIHSIYGFVRFADEIVDTFSGVDRKQLLESFENEYYKALKCGVSLNPVIHSFILTINHYNIDKSLIQAFLKSMKSDLQKTKYSTDQEMNEYIYGSADVVGLMCLRVFVNGDETLFKQLKGPAMKLGSAFQKVNFLRDLKNDTEELRRQYFPELVNGNFTKEIKDKIIKKIKLDFKESYEGIRLLPGRSRLAVAVAYFFYKTLLKKIQKTPAETIILSRIRITDARKILLFIKTYLLYILNLI